MSKEKEHKTNAVREMEAAHADFTVRYFECPEALSGMEGARPRLRVQNAGDAGEIGAALRVHDPRCLRA